MRVRIDSVQPYFDDGEEKYRVILSGTFTKEDIIKMLSLSNENFIGCCFR